MPHPAVDQLTEITRALARIENRRQIAALAQQIENYLLYLAQVLADGDHAQVIAMGNEIEDLKRHFGFHREDGNVWIAGTAQPNLAESTIDLCIPSCAGIAQVPFIVAGVSAGVIDGDLHIRLKVEIA